MLEKKNKSSSSWTIFFFDFNTSVYKNTISIKQLGNKIDSTLSTEVKDRLANISTS